MRILRIITWLIALFALIAMGCVVALYFLINPTSVDKKLQSTLASYGYSIKTNEQPQIRVLPEIFISLPAAKILNEDGESVLHYRQAELTINPLWLAFGKIYIEELKLNGLAYENSSVPTFAQTIEHLKTDKTDLFSGITIAKISLSDADLKLTHQDHSLSLHNLRAEISEPSPQMHGVISLSGQAHIQPNNLLLDVQTAFILDLDLSQGRIGLENFLLQANGTETALPLTISANAPLLKLTPNTLYASTAQLQIERNFTKSSISVAELNIIPSVWQAPDVHAKIITQTPNGEVKFDIRSPMNVDFIKQTVMADHLQGSLVLPGMNEPSTVSGNVLTDFNQKVSKLEVFGRLHEAPMSFTGTIEGFEHPLIQGRLVLGRLKLQDISLLSALSVQKEDSHTTVSDTTETTSSEVNDQFVPVETTEHNNAENSSETMAGNLEQNADNVSGQKDPNAVVSSSSKNDKPLEPTADTALDAPKSDFHFLDSIDFKGEIVVGELFSQKLRLIQLKSPLFIQQGEMKLPAISALAYDGRFTGQMSLNQSGLWETSFKGSGINLQRLLNDAGAVQPASGALNIQANLYGNNFTLSETHGQIGFAISNTQTYGLNLSQSLSSIEKGMPIPKDNVLITQIDQIKGLATISDARAHIESLNVSLPQANLHGQAHVDLITDQLTGELSGSNRRGLKIHLSLEETWFQPKLSLNEEEIKTLNQIIPVTPVPEDNSSKWDKLKQFFNDRF